MNESKLTPKPWTIEEDRIVSPDAIVFRLFGPGRRYIGTVGVGTEVRHQQAADWLPLEEARANALAMHAAPDLLGALAELTRVVECHFAGLETVAWAPRELGAAMTKAHAAISKATGEQS